MGLLAEDLEMNNKEWFDYSHKNRAFYPAPDIKTPVSSKRIWREFIQLLDSKDYRIVDFGCGLGITLHCLEELGYKNLYGIDISDAITSKFLKNTKFVQGDVVDSKFESAYFDVLISNQTIEHVRDDLFVNEISRVLKPNGIAWISSVLRPKLAWYFYKNENGERVLEPTHLKEYRSIKEFKDVFSDRFEIIDIDTTGVFYPVIDPIFRIAFEITKLNAFRILPAESLFFRKMRKIKFPILGYRGIEVLLRKR